MSWHNKNHSILGDRTQLMNVISNIVIITFILNNSLSNAFSAQTLFARKSHVQSDKDKIVYNLRGLGAALTGIRYALEHDLSSPRISDGRPLILNEAAGILKAAIDAERAETGKPAFVEVDKTQGAAIAVSEKLPAAAIKMSSAGQVDVEAIRLEVDNQFSYEYKPQKVIMPDEKVAKRYHFTRDKAEIIRMLEVRNWYYRDYNERDRKAFIERIWDGLRGGLTEHIKKRVTSAVGIKEEDIVSILLYGSWAYTKGTPTDLDIAVIVKGEHIREIIPDCNIERPEQFFTRKGRYVDNFDLSVISEDYLRETTDPTAIDFLTSMWGHGILLEGMDYLRSPPADHNILIKARLLTMLALLYCEDKVREDDGAKINPKDKLRKIERRISEAGKIFKLLFSESHLGIGDEEMGVKPAVEAIDEAVEIINKANGALEDGGDVSEAVFTDSLFSLLGRVWEQAQTVFVEERLITQEVERRLAEIRGLRQKTPQAIPGLTLSGTDRMEPPASTIKPSSAGSVATKDEPGFSVKKAVTAAKYALVTAAAGGLPLVGALVVAPPSDNQHGMPIVKEYDQSDTRTPKPKLPQKPRPARPSVKPKVNTKVVAPTVGKPSMLREAPAIKLKPQPIPQPPTVVHRDRIKVAAVMPQNSPTMPRTTPASALQPGQVKVHPAVIVAEESLSTKEQLNNYQTAYKRVDRIVELVFGDRFSEEQKRCWRLLLLGTEVTETNFLNRYSGVTPSGNGRYQVTGSTAYGIIHNYVTYPIQVKAKGGKVTYRTGMRKELMPLFAKATNNKVSWDTIKKMKKPQLRKLLAANDDFSCLMSLLVYQEVLKREGIKVINSDPKVLGMLWKQYYNTMYGKGTVGRFVRRFGLIHKIPSESLATLYKKTNTEYRRLFFHRGLGTERPEEEAKKRYRQFIEERGLSKDLSNRVARLLRDEYGITPSNISSKLTAFGSMLDNKLKYASLKDDKLVHIVIYRREGKLNTRLVVCKDISQWASRKEKAMADVLIQDRNELYNVLTEPFLNPKEVKDLERIQREAGIKAEPITTLSVPVISAFGAATLAPATSQKPSSAGSSAMMTERPDILLKRRRSHQNISQQA